MNLEELLDQITEADQQDGGQVSVEAVLASVGRRSFGPVLLVVGLATLAPLIGDIPGVPTLMATIVVITSVQLLLGRRYFWLPGWILRRSVSGRKMNKALEWSRRPARFIDRFLSRRLVMFAEGPAEYLIAILCLMIALAMPLMEVVPFSANGAGLALTAFGLALIMRDGLLSLIAFVSTTTTITLVLNYLTG